MARVALHLDGKFTDLISKLFDEPDKDTGEKIFPTLVDLMVFAAMVGRDKFKSCNDVKLTPGGREISSHVIQNLNRDGIAYLLALDDNRDGNILREENDKEMWGYLEKFSSLGLQEIEVWLNGSGSLNVDPKDIILEKMKEIAIRDGLHKSE
jgi:dnd system-associated protein 4